MDPSLIHKLYSNDELGCLHLEGYRILAKHTSIVLCGPCYFRDGVQTEVPTRINIARPTRVGRDLDPQLISHVLVSVGLVPPLPGQSLQEFRQQRSIRSGPSPRQFPFTSALWMLMGIQPPLAKALVMFCEGLNEVQIADKMDVSIYNITERLRKSVNIGSKLLKV